MGYDLDYDEQIIIGSLSAASDFRILPSEILFLPTEDFYHMISVLPADSKLGNYIRIRTETDKDVIKNFNKDEMRIRNEWKKFIIEKKRKLIPPELLQKEQERQSNALMNKILGFKPKKNK